MKGEWRQEGGEGYPGRGEQQGGRVTSGVGTGFQRPHQPLRLSGWEALSFEHRSDGVWGLLGHALYFVHGISRWGHDITWQQVPLSTSLTYMSPLANWG